MRKFHNGGRGNSSPSFILLFAFFMAAWVWMAFAVQNQASNLSAEDKKMSLRIDRLEKDNALQQQIITDLGKRPRWPGN